jgi:hypothetical protein
MPSYRPHANTRWFSAAPALGVGLVEQATRRGWDDQKRFVRTDFVERFAPHRCLHHHAGATAVGRVVDRPVYVVGPPAQVVHREFHDPGVNRLARQRLSQRVQIVGEDRDNVYSHDQPRPSSSRPSGGSISIVWSARDTEVTMALTNGTSTSPSSVRTESNSPAAVCNTSATSQRPCPRSSPRADLRADGRRTRRGPRSAADPRSRRQTGCPSTHRRRCGRPLRRAAQAAGRRARGPTRRRSDSRDRREMACRARRNRREADVGVIGADLDDDLAGDAVRLDDPPDYEVHGSATGRCPPRRRGCPGRRCRRPVSAGQSRCGRHGR